MARVRKRRGCSLNHSISALVPATFFETLTAAQLKRVSARGRRANFDPERRFVVRAPVATEHDVRCR